MSERRMEQLIGSSLLITMLVLAGCDDGRDGPEGDGGAATIGATCAQGSDCASGICIPTSLGEGRCSMRCTSSRMCPTNWTCGDVGGTQACTCDATPESCNGRDDDCDARVDEGSGADVGCAVGEVCSSGACSCPPANVCGGACADLTNDPQNCGACGNECASGQCASGSCCELTSGARSSVDLLLVVDNSNSMAEEQSMLARELPRLVDIITTGDANQDGDNTDAEDFPPVADLHVGVVTTDMGDGGRGVPTCGTTHGDDGILRGCDGTGPAFLSFRPGASSSSAECLATVGTGGCGWEQQLEATLKALSPAAPTSWTAPGYTAPMFAGGTSGHVEDANAGFLRPDSTLAILMLTDEDDCSVLDLDILDPTSTTYTGDLTLRCFLYEDEAVQPIQRFVDGLISLRRTPRDVVFVAIAGIPADLAPEPGAPTPFDVLIGDPSVRDSRMVQQIDPSMPNRLLPSCNLPGRGVAFPPVRIARVAQGLEAGGARVGVQSICGDSLRQPIDAFVRALSEPRLSCAP